MELTHTQRSSGTHGPQHPSTTDGTSIGSSHVGGGVPHVTSSSSQLTAHAPLAPAEVPARRASHSLS